MAKQTRHPDDSAATGAITPLPVAGNHGEDDQDERLAATRLVPTPTRGKARALWRKSRAVELALAGKSYDEIAAHVGYANRGTAWHVVTAALDERAVQGLETHRALELERLDRLLAAHWSEATSGQNVKAAELILKVVAQRAKLLGLDAPATARSESRTIVVSSDHYVDDLRRIVGSEEGR